MSDVRFLEPEASGSDEPLKLWRLSGEILRNETDLGDQTLPRLASFSGSDWSEDFVLGLHAHGGKRDVELGSLVLPLLLDLLREGLAFDLVLAVEEVSGNSALFRLLNKALSFLLLESPDRLFHLNLEKRKWSRFNSQRVTKTLGC